MDSLEYLVTTEVIGGTGSIIIVDDNLYVILAHYSVPLWYPRRTLKLSPKRIFAHGPDSLPVCITSIAPATAETVKRTRVLDRLNPPLQHRHHSGPDNRMSEVWILRSPRR